VPRRRRAGLDASEFCNNEECVEHYEDTPETIPAHVVEEIRLAREAEASRSVLVEDVTPTCDICHEEWDESPDWNGDTGNHLSCEARAAARTMTGPWEEPFPRSADGMPCYCPDNELGQGAQHIHGSRGCHGPRWVNPMGVCEHAQHDLEEDEPEMPRPPHNPDEVELIRCAYVERQCLRRDRNGMVPARDENGRRLTEYCAECDENFCTQHRHLNQRRPENYCDGHGSFHPRCIMSSRCEGCGRAMCPDLQHEQGSDQCAEWLDQQPSEVEYDRSSGYGAGYQGPWREAELLFEGDTPVPGLAEGKRYVSFELEEELRPGASGQFELPEKFGITTDGSLRDNGIEVTFPPSRQDALVENVRIAVDALQRSGYNPSSRCGMHTHIDLRDKQNDNVFLSRLFATFYAVEDVLFAMQDPRRVGNQYCTPLRGGWKFYDAYGVNAPDFDFVFYKMPKSLTSKLRMEEQKQHKGGNRYNAFNFLSVWYRGSLEVRLHEGCLNARQMLMWAELLQKIIERVEDGITYPALRKLLDMPVSAEKVALFGRVFRLPDPMLRYVQERIMGNNRGVIQFDMPYRVQLGTPKKGRPKSILPRRTFRATHRRCRWCSATIQLERRCSYCRRDPSYTQDEFGLADERVMRMRGGRDEYGNPAVNVMTEREFNAVAGITPATGR
jgi:hypothetical protein